MRGVCGEPRFFEAALLAEGDPSKFGYAGYAISTLLRYEMALANASYRALQQLLFLQERRREKDCGIIEAERPVEAPTRLVTPAVAAE